MAISTFKFHLAAGDIPFISSQQPRSVVVGQLDSAGKIPARFAGDQSSYDYNQIQLVYAENVMPASYGWNSVCYLSAVPEPHTNYDGSTVPESGVYFDAQALRRSDPNELELGLIVGMTPELPTNQDNLVLATCRTLVGATVKTTLAWRYPVSYDTRNWRAMQFYDNSRVLAQIETFALDANKAITVATPAGFQFMCVPSVGLFFVGTLQDPFVTGTVDLKFNAVRQYCTSTAPAVHANLQEAQLISDFAGDDTQVTCIAASQGYLIVCYQNIVAWALPIGGVFNFANIANATQTGADSRIPEELIGNITACQPVQGGFILFSEQNAVAAIYSSTNFTNPWTFRQISGAGGVRSQYNVVRDDYQGGVFAVTSAGLQRITLSTATEVSPALNDFISGRQIELFDDEIDTYQTYVTQSDIRTSCSLIGSRYVCVSIGFDLVESFYLVVIYDLQLKRWGKLRQLHTRVFELQDSELPADIIISALGDATVDDLGEATIDSLVTSVEDQYTESRQQIGLMTASGEIVRAVLETPAADLPQTAHMMFGQLQIARARMTVVHSVELEGMRGGSMKLRPSYDGRNLQPPLSTDDWVLVESQGDYMKYAGLPEAQNFNFDIDGQFQLSSIVVRAGTGGQI